MSAGLPGDLGHVQGELLHARCVQTQSDIVVAVDLTEIRRTVLREVLNRLETVHFSEFEVAGYHMYMSDAEAVDEIRGWLETETR